MFKHLPEELVHHIVSFLSVSQRAVVGRVSRQLAVVADDEAWWAAECRQRWPEIIEGSHKGPLGGMRRWKWLFECKTVLPFINTE